MNVYDAKTRLSSLLSKVEAGEEVVIARNGRPIARLTSFERQRSDRVPGELRDQIRIGADFDAFAETDDVDWYGGSDA